MPKRIEVKAGDRFGRWTAIENAEPDKWGIKHFKCVCDCGNIGTPSNSSLLDGRSKSCGCLAAELKLIVKHGHCKNNSTSRLYDVWANIRRRCFNKTNPNYKNYGGRGITICDEWLEFVPFMKWATRHGYEESLTIERIDNDLGYTPGNCEWIPLSKQHQNKRTCIPVVSNGIKFPTIAAAARHFGIPSTTAWYRVKRGVDICQPPKV